MVQSKAPTVAAFLKEADATRRPALTKLRKLVREMLPSSDESMAYGMPTYQKDGKMVAAFKVPVKVVFWPETLPRNANGKILKTELKKIFAPT